MFGFKYDKITQIALLLFILIFSRNLSGQSFNCFSILAGKAATTDGSVMFAHNEDDHGNRFFSWYKVPRLSHDSGEMVELINGGILPQMKVTNEYLWINMPEMTFSDGYMNEYGVTIASNQCTSREDQPVLTDGGIGYMLRRLVAERARSAREGVKIAGRLVERFGYTGSGRSYCIADPDEAWVVAVVQGKHWVAQRIPDNKAAVIPNYYTIGEINLSDTVNFYGAPDIISYAITRGWYDPDYDGRFNFRKAYSNSATLKNRGNITRMWRGINLLSQTKYDLDDEFPFAFLPMEKISLYQLAAILRDHYESTELDLTHNYIDGNPHNTKEATICADHTQYGFIAQLRDYMPAEIGAVLWIAPIRPCVHPFSPWYNGIKEIPEGFQRADYETAVAQQFQPDRYLYYQNLVDVYWVFYQYNKKINQNYLELIPEARKKIKSFENKYFKKQAGFERKMLFDYKEDPEAVRNELTEYTREAAEELLKIIQK